MKRIIPILLLIFLVSCGKPEKKIAVHLINLALVGTNKGIEHSSTAEAKAVTPPITGSARSNYIKTEINSYNTDISNVSERQAKYLDMTQSEFAFYRASAHLYYKDISNSTVAIPSVWTSTSDVSAWIQGDLHLQNYGFFDNDSGTVKFDINDFDESYIAPFYWDLIRLSASVFLIQNQVTKFTLSNSEARTAIEDFLTEYQASLNAVNGNSTETVYEFSKGNLSGFTQSELDKIDNNTYADLLAKWTTVSGGTRTFNFSNPDLTPLTSAEQTEISSNWNAYKTDLGTFASSKPSGYFNIKSAARRLNSGLGSQGITKIYLLIEGSTAGTSDDIILEAKIQKLPSLFLSGTLSLTSYNSRYFNHAKRAKTAMKALLVNADNFAGVLPGTGRSFLVKKISAFKSGLEPKDFGSLSDLKNWLSYSAKSIAYAHSRSDKDYASSFITYNFENSAYSAIIAWPQFKTTVRDLAESYANQVRTDYGYFLTLRSLEDNRSKKGTVPENFRFRMKFRFQKYEDWPNELFAAAQAFRKKYRIYPNIMLANKETYMRIDMIANFRGRSSIGGSDGEKPEKTEYAALGTFVADSFEIDFALSKKLGDRKEKESCLNLKGKAFKNANFVAKILCIITLA